MREAGKILFDESAIAEKVGELASQISKDYAGREVVLVCILKGALAFTADLMRRLSVPAQIEFIQTASYGAATSAPGNILLKKDIELDIRGRHVLLVDTIVDTGKTLDCLLTRLAERNPASLGTIALLDKKCRRTVDVPVAYRGFEIPDEFVVGYGMDHAERYRNLPYIAVLTSDSVA